MDIPLKADVRQLLKVQKALGGEPEYILNLMVQVTTVHEFAAHFLALWLYLGYYPDSGTNNQKNALMVKGIELARTLYDDMLVAVNTKEEVSRNKSPYRNPLQHRLTTGVTDGGAYCLAPSDAARREAAAVRKLDGKSEYKGARFVQPKRRSGQLNGVYMSARGQNVWTW